MSQPAIRVQGLWKEYRVGTRATAGDTFYDLLAGLMRRATGRSGRSPEDDASAAADTQHFWALRDVSFDIQPGEVVGIIGRNGAGKSALLKILSRITAPTRGRIEIRGRLASLLEVGTGFHPELTGRENIFLNGAILGMSRGEVARKFDEIVAFAEVERFIDTPVKRYSSGMYVRLAFAVAAHLEADVLLVDEVLAVGDAIFQEKCLGKMGDLAGSGRTVLLVSHQMASVARICRRGVVLDRGQVIADAPIAAALAAYASLARAAGRPQPRAGGPLADIVSLEALSLNGSAAVGWGEITIEPDQPVRLAIEVNFATDLPRLRVTLCLLARGQRILGLHDASEGHDAEAGRWRFEFEIPPLTLAPGEYGIEVNIYCQDDGRWVEFADAGRFTVNIAWHPLYEPTHAMGAFNLPRPGSRMRVVATPPRMPEQGGHGEGRQAA
jgi:lipopolysaccharide transport system ATP-binding protein